MHNLLSSILKYKQQLLWIAAGAALLLAIFVAKEALVILIGIFVSMFKQPDDPKKVEERVRRAADAAEAVQKAIITHESSARVEKYKAAQDKATEIDNFLDGK